MISRKMIIKNETGLHLKPAAVLCEEARKYSSLITFTCGTATANLKSVLSILGACVHSGDAVESVVSGEDEEEAAAAVCRLIEEGIGG